MPRPRRVRRIAGMPGFTHFAPRGSKTKEEVVLTMGEYEAIRLKDHEGLGQKEAAKKMNVSQPTFNRILKSARKKMAKFLVTGKIIRIEGGDFKMVRPRRGAGRGGRGRQGGFAMGPVGKCVCPKCGFSVPHKPGNPCYEKTCPKCGAKMTRG